MSAIFRFPPEAVRDGAGARPAPWLRRAWRVIRPAAQRRGPPGLSGLNDHLLTDILGEPRAGRPDWALGRRLPD